MNIEDLGQTIRHRRRDLGVAQKKLATIAGISVHTLSDIESGKANPTLSTLDDVLEVLGLELTIQPRRDRPTTTDEKSSSGTD